MRDKAAGANKASRVQAIELLRIVAAYGIVAYHARAPFDDLAYAGLVVFLVLSPMLDVQFNWERARPIGKLARGLLIPWVFWMAAYGAMNGILHKPILPKGLTGILYGTNPHLWFLPLMFLVLAALNMIKPRAPGGLFWTCAIAAAGLLATVSLWRAPSLTWVLPFPQWIHAAPVVLSGVVLGLAGRMGNGRVLALLLLAAALVVADTAMLPGIGIPYTVGIAGTAIAAFYGQRLLPSAWSVQPIAACMMGVYLCHTLVLKIISMVTGRGNYLTVTLTFVISLLGVWTVRRLIPMSKLILG